MIDTSTLPAAAARGHHCAHCQVELAPDALACPACLSLLHADALKQLAARAEGWTAEGRLAEARQAWEEALALLPFHAPQHAAVTGRIDALDRRIAETQVSARPARAADGRLWWQRGAAALVAVALLLLGKGKFLALGLTKASTFLSMFTFIGVYWVAFGWPLAVGMGVSIYIHEMGHVAMLRRLGIAAGAPLFIPGVGAVVLLKRHVADPITDALIGLAGPVWGLGAGLAAYGAGMATGAPIWLAIAQLTGYLNLFNLLPFWQLDGARGFHALSRPQRWAVVVVLAMVYVVTWNGLLLLVGAVAAYRAWQPDAGPGDRRTLATFVVLILALTWLTTLGPPLGG